jgi:hypothetical protein
MLICLNLAISVRGGHCEYLPRASINLAMPLGSATAVSLELA